MIRPKTDYQILMRPLLGPVLGLWVFSVIFSIVLGDLRILYSSTLGVVFSFWGFRNLIKSQAKILQLGKEKFFMPFINRLLIYAIPIALLLSKKNYFHLEVVLIFLWVFQVLFVGKEFLINYRSIRRK